MSTSVMLSWIVLLLYICALSTPFIAFNIWKCQAANPKAPAPFPYYEAITSGLNLCVAGVFSYWCEFFFFGKLLLGAGVFMAMSGYLSLTWWYRDNPRYTARLFD